MNVLGFLFAAVTVGMLFGLQRRWAPLALLIGTTYISLEQQLQIGPFHLPVVRLLIAFGLVRVLMKGERVFGGINLLDRIMFLWAAWAICSLIFHKSSIVVFRLGVVYDILGSYLLFRIFIRGITDLDFIFKMVGILLVPLAVLMVVEKLRGQNPFGYIGFGQPIPELRKGYFRAQGAFGHSILAGNVGAVCLPMGIALWNQRYKLAPLLTAAAFAIVLASGSSGPVMTAFTVLLGLAFWKIKGHLRVVRWLGLAALFGLNCIMNDPVYFLIARIDIAGGSTGYFRSQLIRSTIEHFTEWWLAGTDYTRHWMATGIPANADHTDMTNYYIQMGVWGGVALVLLFVAMLWAGFSRVGKVLRFNSNLSHEQQFLVWTLGCILFGHATTFVSISYFDQTIVYLCLAVACIGSIGVLEQVESAVLINKPGEGLRDSLASNCPSV